MNTLGKALTGLAVTGTTIGGGLTWMYWPTSKKSEEAPREISNEEWKVIRNNRVASLTQIFLKYSNNEEAKKDLAEIISANRNNAVIFYIAEGATNFSDPGYAATEIGSWCNRNEDSPLISRYPELNKEEICKH